MHYIRIGFTVFLLAGMLFSLIYTLAFLIKFLAKRLSRREVIKRTFWVAFCGWMSMFLAYSIWQTGWDIEDWMFFLVVSVSISAIGAISFIASFWTRKE